MRMGAPKLRLPWRGKTIIEHTIGAWLQGGVDRVLAVVRADDRELADLIRQAGAVAVLADPPPADMKASVQAGLADAEKRFQPGASDVWMMAPADLPALSAEAVRRLLASHDVASPTALVAAHQGRRGHPVLLPWPLAARLEALTVEEGINRLIEREGAVLIECGENAICADLDTPADYERWQGESPR
jgi:molybdenum cofactor cytidylyltransferase